MTAAIVLLALTFVAGAACGVAATLIAKTSLRPPAVPPEPPEYRPYVSVRHRYEYDGRKWETLH